MDKDVFLYDVEPHTEWPEADLRAACSSPQSPESRTQLIKRRISEWRYARTELSVPPRVYQLLQAHASGDCPWRLCLSEDESVLAVVKYDIVSVLRTSDLTEICTFTINQDPQPQLRRVTLSRDGKLFAVSSSGGSAVVYECTNGSMLLSLSPNLSAYTFPASANIVSLFFRNRSVGLVAPELVLIRVDTTIQREQCSNGPEPPPPPPSQVPSNHLESLHDSVVGSTFSTVSSFSTSSLPDNSTTVITSCQPYLTAATAASYCSSKQILVVAGVDSTSGSRVLPSPPVLLLYSFSNNVLSEAPISIISCQHPVLLPTVAISPNGFEIATVDIHGNVWLTEVDADTHASVSEHEFSVDTYYESKVVSQVNWWTDSALTVVRRNGQLSIHSISDFSNLLGTASEQFYSPLTVIQCSNQERVFVLEVESDTESSPSVDSSPAVFRLLSLVRLSIDEMFEKKIRMKDYGSALLLAKRYGLSTNHVYKQQWQLAPVDRYSIQDYLKKVDDIEWRLNQCLNRIANDADSMKELLDYGLWLTKSIRDGPVSDQSRELLRSRRLLLHYLYKLQSYKAIFGSNFDQNRYRLFREADPVDLSTALAKDRNFIGLKVMFTYHGQETSPYRLNILCNVPVTVDPQQYAELLPAVEDAWPVKRWFKEEFCERPEIMSQLGGDLELNRKMTSVQDGPMDDSAEGLSLFYEMRAKYMEQETRTVDFAVRLLSIGQSKGVSGLADLIDGLHDYEVVVRDLNRKDISFDKFQDMNSLERLKLVLEDATPSSVVKMIQDRLLKPLTAVADVEVAHKKRLQFYRTVHAFLCDRSRSDLSMAHAVVAASSPVTQVENRIIQDMNQLQQTALACVYSSMRTDQLDLMESIYECLPERKSDDRYHSADLGDIRGKQLQDAVDNFNRHLRFCEELSSFQLPRPLNFFLSAEMLELLQMPNEMEESDTESDDESDGGVDPTDESNWSFEERAKREERATVLAVEQKRTKESKKQLIERQEKRHEQEVKELFLLVSRVPHKLEDTFSDAKWRKLCQFMLDLEACFPWLPRGYAYELFLPSLLEAGKFSLAKDILNKPSVVQALGRDKITQIVLTCSRELFNSASSLDHPWMDLAKTCLDLLQWSDATVNAERDLFQAAHIVTGFGVPLVPLQLRLATDKFEIFTKILQTNPTAYKSHTTLIRLLGLLTVPSLDDKCQLRERIGWAAMGEQDFEHAKIMCDSLIESRYAEGWKLCAALAQTIDYPQLENRFNLLAFAMRHAPVNAMDDLLMTWKKIDSDLHGLDPTAEPSLDLNETAQIVATAPVYAFYSNKSHHSGPGYMLSSGSWIDMKDESTIELAEFISHLQSQIRRQIGQADQQLVLSIQDRIDSVLSCVSYYSFNSDFLFGLSCLLHISRPLHGEQVFQRLLAVPYLPVEHSRRIMTVASWFHALCAITVAGKRDVVEDIYSCSLVELLQFLPQPAVPTPTVISPAKTKSHPSRDRGSLVRSPSPDSDVDGGDKGVQIDWTVLNDVTDEERQWIDICTAKAQSYYSMSRDSAQAETLVNQVPGIDVSRFSRDPDYRREIILSLATKQDIQVAVELAQAQQVPLWDVYMTHVEWILLHNGSNVPAIQEKVLKFEKHLLQNPVAMKNRLLTAVYPRIHGYEHEKLLYLYSLLVDAEQTIAAEPTHGSDRTALEALNSHIKVLSRLSKVAPDINYKFVVMKPEELVHDIDSIPDSNIAANEEDISLREIRRVVTDQNVHVIARLNKHFYSSKAPANCLSSSSIFLALIERLLTEPFSAIVPDNEARLAKISFHLEKLDLHDLNRYVSLVLTPTSFRSESVQGVLRLQTQAIHHVLERVETRLNELQAPVSSRSKRKLLDATDEPLRRFKSELATSLQLLQIKQVTEAADIDAHFKTLMTQVMTDKKHVFNVLKLMVCNGLNPFVVNQIIMASNSTDHTHASTDSTFSFRGVVEGALEDILRILSDPTQSTSSAIVPSGGLVKTGTNRLSGTKKDKLESWPLKNVTEAFQALSNLVLFSLIASQENKLAAESALGSVLIQAAATQLMQDVPSIRTESIRQLRLYALNESLVPGVRSLVLQLVSAVKERLKETGSETVQSMDSSSTERTESAFEPTAEEDTKRVELYRSGEIVRHFWGTAVAAVTEENISSVLNKVSLFNQLRSESYSSQQFIALATLLSSWEPIQTRHGVAIPPVPIIPLFLINDESSPRNAEPTQPVAAAPTTEGWAVDDWDDWTDDPTNPGSKQSEPSNPAAEPLNPFSECWAKIFHALIERGESEVVLDIQTLTSEKLISKEDERALKSMMKRKASLLEVVTFGLLSPYPDTVHDSLQELVQFSSVPRTELISHFSHLKPKTGRINLESTPALETMTRLASDNRLLSLLVARNTFQLFHTTPLFGPMKRFALMFASGAPVAVAGTLDDMQRLNEFSKLVLPYKNYTFLKVLIDLCESHLHGDAASMLLEHRRMAPGLRTLDGGLGALRSYLRQHCTADTSLSDSMLSCCKRALNMLEADASSTFLDIMEWFR